MTKPSPCYKCEKRTVTCHDNCENYAEFDRENKQRLEKRYAENQAKSDALSSPARDYRKKKYAMSRNRRKR